MGFAAIGGLVLLLGLCIWIAIGEAKTGATYKESAKAMKEVINATKRFNKAVADSRGLPRRERIQRMLSDLRAGNR